MAIRPTVVVFDVNETLSDLSPMAQRFSDVVPGMSGSSVATPALTTMYGVAERLMEKGMIRPAW